MWGRIGHERHKLQAQIEENWASFGGGTNPFAADAELFFPATQQQQFLELLRHLSRYSNLLLTVTGQPGSGKTCLRRRFVQDLDMGVQVCELDASLTATAAQLLAGLVQLLELDVDANADLPAYIERIRHHVALLHEDGRSCLIVLDNAHELQEDAIELILQLASVTEDARRPHFVLVGRSELMQLLTRPALKSRYEAIGHHLELKPLNADEVEAYIRYRCQAFGWEPDMPFDGRQLAQIRQQSGGLPGRINQIAAQLLNQGSEIAELDPDELIPPVQDKQPARKARNKKVKAEPNPSKRGKQGTPIPIWHISALVLVGAVLIVLFLYQDEPGTETVELDLNNPVQQNQAEITAAPIPEPVKPALPAAPVPETEAVTEPQVAVPVPEPVAEPEPPVTRDPAPAEETVMLAETQPEPEPEPDPEPQVTQPAEPAPAPKPQVAQSGSPYKKETELLNTDPDSYTLQMLGARAERSAVEFIKRQPAPAEFTYFETLYKGEPWYVVLYGEFPSRDAAVAAVKELPQALRKQRPWARSFAGVQNDIRKKE